MLDTGVDPDHQDIDIKNKNWAEFDSDGDRVNSKPHDENGHGTHVSGTATGGNASGTAIGVAPNATLMHGKVLDDDGSGTFAQVIAGMQWAVKNDADVMSMSLGANGYREQMIDPVRNAEDAGVVVIAAIGNDGPGTSGSPGNVYETVGVGASNEKRNIASFSGGENISTSNAWGSDAPSDWPDYYIVPDVAAPGVDVLSATPGKDEYAKLSGTSMATPHVAGTVALMLSAAEKHAGNNPSVPMVKQALEQTAVDIGASETRQGAGIVDANAATDYLVNDTNVSVQLAQNFPRHLETGENGTATFRVSNVKYVTVNLTAASDADPNETTVFVDGQKANIGENVSVSDGSKDGFTITVQTNETYVDTLALEITFENPQATSPTATTVYPPLVKTMRVHPDPLPAGDSANRFNGSDPVTNATEYAAAGTTVEVEEGFYDEGLTAWDVEPGVTVTAAPDANVTLNASEPVWLLGDHMTLSNVSIDVNSTSSGASTSSHSAGIYIDNAEGVTVDNVEVNNATIGIFAYNATSLTISESSVSSTANDFGFSAGVSVWESDDVVIENTEVNSENIGVEMVSSQGSTMRNLDVDSEEYGIAAVAMADSQLTSSDVRASDGPAVLLLASDAVTVSDNYIQGSNVSAGFTGAVVSEFNGLGYSSLSSSELSNLGVLEKQTRNVAGKEISGLQFSPQSESELQATAEDAPETLSEVRSDVVPADANASEVQNMNKSELAELAKDDAKQLRDGAKPQIHGVEFDEIVEEIGVEPVVYENNRIEGEAAGVVSAVEIAVYRNNEITNISYPHYGVYNLGSLVKLENNTIDHAPRTGVESETGVVSYVGFTFMENNYINATNGVKHPWWSFYSITWSEGNEVHADNAYVNKGLFTFMFLRGGDEVHAEYGVRSGWLGLTLVTYTDLSDTETAIYGESQTFFGEEFGALPVLAPLNYYGDDRGPAIGDDIVIDDEPTVFEESGWDIEPAVYYDPFLTAPVDQVSLDPDETQQFGTDVVMEPGKKYAFGVPGPVQGNLSDMFNNFEGVVYVFDAETQEWSLATGDEQLSALEAVVVVPQTEARFVTKFENYGGPSVPPTTDLSEGWNFIGASEYGPAEEAYASSADLARIAKFFEEPERQGRRGDDFGTYTFGADSHGPDVSATSGYFVYAKQNGSMAANLPKGASVADYFELTGAFISGVTASEETEANSSDTSSDGSAGATDGSSSIDADDIAPSVNFAAP
ncbi:MAG: S8 family serine peptidase [Halopenitus sp.]